MKFTAQTDIKNALRLLNKALPETDEELDVFISEVESGAIEIPDGPSYLTPTTIAEALSQGRRPAPAATITEFPQPQSQPGIEGLQMAARNGDGPLSEETIRKMKEAQDEDEN
jgi:hypothetical protein